jgi:hypothetical protein
VEGVAGKNSARAIDDHNTDVRTEFWRFFRFDRGCLNLLVPGHRYRPILITLTIVMHNDHIDA